MTHVFAVQLDPYELVAKLTEFRPIVVAEAHNPRKPTLLICPTYTSIMYVKAGSKARVLVVCPEKVAELVDIPMLPERKLVKAVSTMMADTSPYEGVTKIHNPVKRLLNNMVQVVTETQVISWFNTMLYALPTSSRDKARKALIEVLTGAPPETIRDVVSRADGRASAEIEALVNFLNSKSGSIYVGALNTSANIPPFEREYFSRLRKKFQTQDADDKSGRAKRKE